MTIDPTIPLARATAEGEAEYRALVGRLRSTWSDLEPIPRQPSLSTRNVHNGIWITMRATTDHADVIVRPEPS